jgi:WD40 repeat protein
VAFSPDGRTLVSGSLDSNLLLWDPATGQPVGQPLTDHPKNVLNLAYSPDGRHIASVGAGKWVILWQMGAGAGAPRGFSLDGHTGQVYAAAFSPDGRILATGSRDREIILWDVEGREALGLPLEGHEGWILGLSFSPDGRMLASASADGTARLWDVTGLGIGDRAQPGTKAAAAKGLRTGSGPVAEPLCAPLSGHSNWVNSVAFSPDGQLLATASSDNTIQIWDPRRCVEAVEGACQPLGDPLRGHTTQVWSLAFHPAGSGQVLVSGSADGTVLVWDLETREPLGPPLLGGIEMETMALSPDGSTVALGALDTSGLVYLWKLDLRPWQMRACAIANRNLTEAEWHRYLGATPYHKTCPEMPWIQVHPMGL